MAFFRPLRVNRDIRDLVTSPTSAVAIGIASLEKTIGYPVSLDAEWPILWATLQSYYVDPAVFIPSVSSVLVSWCDVFTAWLEAEENEDWVEKLIEEMRPVVKIVIGVSLRSPGFLVLRAESEPGMGAKAIQLK